PSNEGYRNTIELPDRNNVVPLRSDTIRLVQNGCSFHGLRCEDLNQHLKDFLKRVDSLDLDVAIGKGRACGESLSEAWTRFKDLIQKVCWEIDCKRLNTGSITNSNSYLRDILAQRIAEEEELNEQQKKRRAQV
ncbi:hypothetical protein Tco_1240737, partial [Tanacetum coccineum]